MDFLTEVQKAQSAIRIAMETLRPLQESGLQAPQKRRIEQALGDLARASTTLATDAPSGDPELACEPRQIPGSVRQIDLRGALDVIVRSGAEPGLTVFANRPEDLAKVWTTVSRGCLTIDCESTMVVTSDRTGSKQIFNGPVGMFAGRDIIHGNARIHIAGEVGEIVGDSQSARGFRVEVTLPHVTDLCVSGAGTLICRDLDQEAIHLDLAGAGSIAATGTVKLLHAVVSGAGSIGGYDLTSSHAHLDVTGAGSIKATVTESVHARMSGVGKIKVAGNPPVRNTDVTGFGKIKFV